MSIPGAKNQASIAQHWSAAPCGSPVNNRKKTGARVRASRHFSLFRSMKNNERHRSTSLRAASRLGHAILTAGFLISMSRCQTAHTSSFPRRVFCAQALHFVHSPRNRGVAERRQAHLLLFVAHLPAFSGFGGRVCRAAQRGAHVRLRERTLAFRRSTVARIRTARSRTFRSRRFLRAARDATPRFAFRIVSRRRPSCARMRIFYYGCIS